MAAVRAFVFMAVSVRSAANMHSRGITRVLRAQLPTFFDITPTGQTINKFGKDLDNIDSLLPIMMFVRVEQNKRQS